MQWIQLIRLIRYIQLIQSIQFTHTSTLGGAQVHAPIELPSWSVGGVVRQKLSQSSPSGGALHLGQCFAHDHASWRVTVWPIAWFLNMSFCVEITPLYIGTPLCRMIVASCSHSECVHTLRIRCSRLRHRILNIEWYLQEHYSSSRALLVKLNVCHVLDHPCTEVLVCCLQTVLYAHVSKPESRTFAMLSAIRWDEMISIDLRLNLISVSEVSCLQLLYCLWLSLICVSKSYKCKWCFIIIP